MGSWDDIWGPPPGSSVAAAGLCADDDKCQHCPSRGTTYYDPKGEGEWDGTGIWNLAALKAFAMKLPGTWHVFVVCPMSCRLQLLYSVLPAAYAEWDGVVVPPPPCFWSNLCQGDATYDQTRIKQECEIASAVASFAAMPLGPAWACRSPWSSFYGWVGIGTSHGYRMRSASM